MQEAVNLMNSLGASRKPFLFIIDFDMKKPLVFPSNEIPADILFKINDVTNTEKANNSPVKDYFLHKTPVSFQAYQKAFDKVISHLKYGNSYLINLTQPTLLECNLSLQDIYHQSTAKYKLCYKDEFVVFSPEIFVKINDYVISSFPMKGTIDASLPDAEKAILNDKKETAEHYTIVDLIRNDLSMVSKNVKVERFRYIDHLYTNNKHLLQVSSQINGDLPHDFHLHLGDIIFKLLPAGSISGAPKKKTIEIIKEAEIYERGYYTGVFGYFDGNNLDSGVMIRFIENDNQTMLYKSGGGITVNSIAENEYQELIDKVYLPFINNK